MVTEGVFKRFSELCGNLGDDGVMKAA